jgi:hypothetical protein
MEPMRIESEKTGYQSLRELLRVVAAFLGVIAIAAGLYLSVTLFMTVKSGLQDPESVAPTIQRWARLLAEEGDVLEFAGGEHPADMVLAVAVVGGGALLLMWIAVGLLTAGARVVSWTISDVEAVKRLASQIMRAPARRPYGDEASMRENGNER